MKKNLFGSLMAAVAMLLFVSCKDTHEKAQDFVDDYNASTKMMVNPNIQSTVAELRADNTIVIAIVSTMEQSEENKSIMDQMLPTIMNEVLGKITSFNELVNEGIKFRIKYMARDNTELGVTDIDKASLKVARQKSSQSAVNDTQFSASDPKVNEMLAMINKALPIIDKEAGTKITKIDIVGENLIYFVEVEKSMKELIKTENFNALMKEEILRNPQTRTLFNGVKQFGVKHVKYRYLDENKKTIGEISINEKEL